MKRLKILFTILFSTLVLCAFGQSDRKAQKVQDEALIKIFNNLTLLAEQKTEDLLIRVYSVGNPSGSAGTASCEITHNIYIAVSEYGEYPAQNLFALGPFFNPKVKGWSGTESEQHLLLEIVENTTAKTQNLIITLNSVVIE